MKATVMVTKVMIMVRSSHDDNGGYDGGEVFLNDRTRRETKFEYFGFRKWASFVDLKR